MARRKFAKIGLISVLPSLLVDLVLHAIGEVAGCWSDSHSAIKTYQKFEMDRLSCVTEKDRAPPLPQLCGLKFYLERFPHLSFPEFLLS